MNIGIMSYRVSSMYSHNRKIVILLIAAFVLELSLVIVIQVLILGVHNREYLGPHVYSSGQFLTKSVHDSYSSTSTRCFALRTRFISELDVCRLDSHNYV